MESTYWDSWKEKFEQGELFLSDVEILMSMDKPGFDHQLEAIFCLHPDAKSIYKVAKEKYNKLLKLEKAQHLPTGFWLHWEKILFEDEISEDDIVLFNYLYDDKESNLATEIFDLHPQAQSLIFNARRKYKL